MLRIVIMMLLHYKPTHSKFELVRVSEVHWIFSEYQSIQCCSTTDLFFQWCYIDWNFWNFFESQRHSLIQKSAGSIRACKLLFVNITGNSQYHTGSKSITIRNVKHQKAQVKFNRGNSLICKWRCTPLRYRIKGLVFKFLIPVKTYHVGFGGNYLW